MLKSFIAALLALSAALSAHHTSIAAIKAAPSWNDASSKATAFGSVNVASASTTILPDAQASDGSSSSATGDIALQNNGVSFQQYAPATENAWLLDDIPDDALSQAEHRVSACISASTSPDSCEGDFASFCTANLSYTPDQCYRIEAAAWENVGYAYFAAIAEQLPDPAVLLASQEDWNEFARSECAVVNAVYSSDPFADNLRSAICPLQLTAMRVTMLYQLSLGTD